MASVEDSAYPRLLPEPRPRELQDFYTPTIDELEWAASKVKATAHARRYALLVLLKMVQHLGYFPKLNQIPSRYLEHIAGAVGIELLTASELRECDDTGPRARNVALVRDRMEIRPLDDEAWLFEHAEKAALTQHQVSDIINVMLEELVHHRYELPGFTTLERIARRSRERVESQHYDSITSQLSTNFRGKIDELFKSAKGGTSAWNALKQEPARPSVPAVREYLDHVRKLQALSVGLPPVSQIPLTKLKHYRAHARAQNAPEMLELVPKKRYALAVIYIRSCHARALDDATDLYIRLFDKMKAAAERRLRQYQLDRAKAVDELIERFHGTLEAYLAKASAAGKMKAIQESLRNDAAMLKEMCEEHLAFSGHNFLPFLLNRYPGSRSLFFNCLDIISPKSTSDNRHMEALIGALERLRHSRMDYVDLAELGIDPKVHLSWMSNSWRRLIFDVPDEASGLVHRKALELSIIQRIRDDLSNGDLFVARGEKYDDYREQLANMETVREKLPEFGEATGIDVESSVAVESLRSDLAKVASDVDKRFRDNEHASIVDGQLSLKTLKKTVQPEAAEALDLFIRDRMLPVSILDVLIDVERWLNLHRHFKHLAGTETRLDDIRKRFVTTLFCYGCNLGAVQTSRSIKGISRRQISWLNLKYVSEEALDKAIAQVTNAYIKYELPEHWGSNKSASADGTKWGLYEQNVFSEFHVRYGGYGGIGYYHVTGSYIAFFSRFSTCSVYEGVYLLDALEETQSDVQPDTVHGDTHSQNLTIFAVAHLLGIKLMPRIRGIKKLHFFRPTPGAKYKHIDDIFTQPINWKLIQTHYQEMLRVAVSIRLGRISSSTILRRFGNKNQSRLALAFRELGKVIRTKFLLQYIDTAELRKIISAATNKSEAFNNFIQWVFFGSEGIIQENVAHEQRKMIKYSHLVANMVCLYNVQNMTRVIRELQAEGVEVTSELLGFLSPYRTWHINRFGDYVLDYERASDEMDPALKLFLQ